MRAKYLLTTMSVLSLYFAGNISSVLADDVYVDLSVLDSLEGSSFPINNQGPLFPIVSSSDSHQDEVKVKKPSRKIKKNIIKKKKLEIPSKQVVKVETPKQEKETVAKKQEVSVESKVTAEKIPFKTAPAEPQKENVQAAPSVAVKSEPLPTVENKVENTQSAVPAQTQEQSSISNNSNTEQAPEPVVKEPAQAVASEPEVDNFQNAEAKEEKPSLLIDTKQDNASSSSKTEIGSDIFFAAESDALLPEDETKINNIIATFENPQENKIAIFSFNLDDGNDSFRKKRISLNRAIAVRSYLLNKGYKNFSIKVVNLNEANGKENSVHIEELK